jgi:CPA2 family monovalent cation:H+ antiporter-2
LEFNILETILCVFLISLLVSATLRKLRLSIILGYLLVGAVVGPNALGLMHDSSFAKHLAEFGIVFLMFTVGLEFSLSKLFTLRYVVFVVGGLQVLLTIVITILMGKLIGMGLLAALVVGTIVAMSSTAIVVKQLDDQLELQTPQGLSSVSVLLFQDLAVIPIIILIASLGRNSDASLTIILMWALVKGVFAILLIFFLGIVLLKPLFRQIAKMRDIELFTLTVLLVTLGAAWLTNLFGLSYALGAFLAGLMLAETEFRHQIEVEIRPFRDILLGLFFITVGMLANFNTWAATWHWILLLVLALTVFKGSLIAILVRLNGNNSLISARTGIILAQGGEFGFAILTLALNHNLLTDAYGQVILGGLLISIALSPILIRFNQTIAEFFLLKKGKQPFDQSINKIKARTKKLKNHVIICGYGRVGQHIARLLDHVKTPYIGLDLDSELIRFAGLAGDRVLYGNPAHPEILKAAGLDDARVLIISFNDFRASRKILSMLKQTHPELPVIVRCRDQFELKKLKEEGRAIIIAELYEASLTLSHHLLNILEIPTQKIEKLLAEARSKDYEILQKIFTGSYEETMADTHAQHGLLKPVTLMAKSSAVNKKIKMLNLPHLQVEIIAIRRGEKKFMKPNDNTKLLEGDILILHGEAHHLENAERILS